MKDIINALLSTLVVVYALGMLALVGYFLEIKHPFWALGTFLLLVFSMIYGIIKAK